MYEDAAAVPFLMAGPDVPSGKVVATPVSLIDSFPTILEGVGARQTEADADLPGESLWAIAQDGNRDRTVFGEYHAVGAKHGAYMLRNLQYKYIYYVNDPPQLFDATTDPDECRDLAPLPDSRDALEILEYELREIVDPEAVDAQAKAAQKAEIDALGGKEAMIRRGAFDNSPVPGEAPAFRQHVL